MCDVTLSVYSTGGGEAMSESGDFEHKQALPRGHVLHDRYELLAVLGVGGFGVTYLGHDEELERRVAIKEYFPNEFAVREGTTVHPKSVGDREDVEWGLDRFLDEARTLARFRHPNLVRVIDYFKGNGTAYIVMDYEDGEPLDEVLDRLGRLTESQLRKVLLPIVDGLGEVHRAGFLHRDIKPSNVFIRRADESPVLLDFGAARQALGRKSRSMTSVVSAGYSPPEQYESEGKQGVWTDIYALSALCFRAIAGRVPVDAPRRAGALLEGGADPLPRLTESPGVTGFSMPFLESVDRGLRMVAGQRPASLDEWSVLLGGAVSRPGRSVGSAPSRPDETGSSERLPEWDRALNDPGRLAAGAESGRADSVGSSVRNKWWFVGATATVLILAASAFLFFADGTEAPPPSENGPAPDPQVGPRDAEVVAPNPADRRPSPDPNDSVEGEPDESGAGSRENSDDDDRVPAASTAIDPQPESSTERSSAIGASRRVGADRAESVTHLDRVQAGSTDVYELTFVGGMEATVLVAGDGDTDLDLYVVDEEGNRVCVDENITDLMACSWMPPRTAEFRVAIRNLGDVYNEYTLRTNSRSGGFVKTVIATHIDRVQAESTDVYVLTFVGGTEAEVLVEGDGDTDLDLYVVDEAGNRVCVDEGITDLMVCSWTPPGTDEFRVAIRNLGDVYNEYALSTSNSSGGFVKTVIATHVDVVEAESTDVYELTFVGGMEATVFVEGDGDTDLDLYVVDEAGNRVCVEDDYTDVMICSWRPPRTAEYRVAIRNLGDVYNEYTLSTSNSSGDFAKAVIAAAAAVPADTSMHAERVQAGSTDVYKLAFVVGEEATVLVEGDGDTDLDLYVLDESGSLICADTGPTDRMLCSWIPATTGEFRVEVRNLGDVYNDYSLQTNGRGPG
jgi:serine/threonine protein kinase/uncharacterized protein YhfF